ncbi:hypothetical protein BGI32_06625 [Snodgrassella alvi]|uniref:RHS protein conserved region domain-containing protein n=1 Tax=Snodgrassella alvi TaxID=1196083 RepID=A0A2N9WTK6_9NEIS|nr:RHS repeat-associated core domain-containing protein [Snodgrassella alvi]PIT14925.1 hypothetical protein BGI32_06625 [Snodgrassella alvi]
MIQETGPNHPTSLYIYTDQNSYEPLARIDTDGNQEQHIRYFHTDLNGCPEELTDENGKILWECSFQLWGKRIHEIEHEPIEQNLRYQGQYLDRETGLHYNTFRYYDPDIGRFTQPDPIGLLGGFNLYQYAPNGLTWIDPWGWSSCRLRFMGRTPSKKSKTGQEVINRMRGEKRIIGEGNDMYFKSSTDGKWYNIKDADMAHKTDAVAYWNQTGGFHGPKSKDVRGFMRDPNNYELEYFRHNRSQGAKLGQTYKKPEDFIGPAEKSSYF